MSISKILFSLFEKYLDSTYYIEYGILTVKYFKQVSLTNISKFLPLIKINCINLSQMLN